ncbi:MAG TPA: hypothetical protein VJR89_37075 [Polyangiales bacterium]|nr:hypothetical protein [Polyangiales bacterium]
MRGVSLVLVLAVFESWAMSACGPDLGTCDMDAAKKAVYLNGVPYTEGQALIYQNCAGSQCHAASAVGASRTGAPHGLDFDVSPMDKTSTADKVPVLQAGIGNVRDEADELWQQVDSGKMPPGKAGDRPDLPWTDVTGTVNVMLTGLDLAEARDKVRNWLACAAPIYAATSDSPQKDAVMALGAVGDPGTPPSVGPSWSSVYTNVLSSCGSCHNPSSPFSNQALDLSNKDTAYMQLVGKMAFSGSGAMCSGRTFVIPKDCQNSLLYQKLQPKGAVANLCGMPMPYGSPDPVPEAQRKAVCDWITAGAMND